MDKMVVLQPVTFRTKKEFNLHKILRAIDTNVILSKLTEVDWQNIRNDDSIRRTAGEI
jgi:DNA polymerase-3 subunit alpha/error-prone DNA polymerase